MSLEISGVDAWYGQAQVLFGVDMAVGPGEVVGVFGHNGAGKSTLLRTVAGVHRQAKGRITDADADLLGLRADTIARRGLYLVREGAKAFQTLTVHENLQLGARLARRSGRQARAMEEIYDLFPLLADRRETQAGLLSGGQRQALALAVGYASHATCLLLDEPSTGLAPSIVETVYEIISRLAEDGASLLIAEQNPDWLSHLATRGYLLETGSVAASGIPASFLGTAH